MIIINCNGKIYNINYKSYEISINYHNDEIVQYLITAITKNQLPYDSGKKLSDLFDLVNLLKIQELQEKIIQESAIIISSLTHEQIGMYFQTKSLTTKELHIIDGFDNTLNV